MNSGSKLRLVAFLLAALGAIASLAPAPRAPHPAAIVEAGSDLSRAAAEGYVGELRALSDGAVFSFAIPAWTTLTLEDAIVTRRAARVAAFAPHDVPLKVRETSADASGARFAIEIGPCATSSSGAITVQLA